jgi:ParB family chromosome partitioning protein
VAGDCRYQAFLSLGRSEIPAFVCELNAENISVARATENLQRSDLSIIEEAKIYKRLHEDHNMSWEAIGKRTGKGPGVVKRRADLMKLPEILINALHEKKILYGAAEELAALKDVNRIQYFLGYAIDHGATVAVIRDWVREELALIRQHAGDVGGGDWGSVVPEIKPIYVSCDICAGPMEISKVVYKRICADCDNTIKQNM